MKKSCSLRRVERGERPACELHAWVLCEGGRDELPVALAEGSGDQLDICPSLHDDMRANYDAHSQDIQEHIDGAVQDLPSRLCLDADLAHELLVGEEQHEVFGELHRAYLDVAGYWRTPRGVVLELRTGRCSDLAGAKRRAFDCSGSNGDVDLRSGRYAADRGWAVKSMGGFSITKICSLQVLLETAPKHTMVVRSVPSSRPDWVLIDVDQGERKAPSPTNA